MKVDLRTILTCSIGTLLVMGLIGFSAKRQSSKGVSGIAVTIENENGNFFLDENEVISLVEELHNGLLINSAISTVDLKSFEKGIERNAFVKDAQVYYDVKGQLQVLIHQTRPIGRLLNYGGMDRYVDADGRLLPLNARHTARVPIVEVESGEPWESCLQESDIGKQLWELLRYIEDDPFWRAQIAHVILDGNNEIEMIPQITKQTISFGKPDQLEAKFKRLLLFYKQVLPAKGWNTYSNVNVKYKNQIVCK